jgi:putative isomerase
MTTIPPAPLIDTSHTPWSAYGHQLAVVHHPTQHQLVIHSCRHQFGKDRMWVLAIERAGQALPFTVAATPWQLNVTVTGGGAVRLALERDTGLLVEADGVDLLWRLDPHFGYGCHEGEGKAKIISSQGHNYHALDTGIGNMDLLGPEERHDTGHVRQRGSDVRVRAVSEQIVMRLDISELEQDPRRRLPAVGELEATALRRQSEWQRFAASRPAVPAGHGPQADLAWYTLWSCFARAEGTFASDAALGAKVYMCGVWSWDHCFYALALASSHPALALDQYLLPFHLQAANGALPDMFAPNTSTIWGVTKVPIHGWCFAKLMDRITFPRLVLEQARDQLARWTEWYRVYRDRDQDGVVEVAMGCDDQDNGSAFLGAYFVESPDVTAYLALQEDTLARICDRLGRTAEASQWRADCAARVQALVRHCWDGECFYHSADPDHTRVPDHFGNTTIMPLVLGSLLPPDVFAATAARLEREFLGVYGVASEAFRSPHYRDDGYWLGSVWAPLQLLLVDGLLRGGRADLARTISGRYLDGLKQAGGMWEVIDAKTGAGQRCGGFAWTAAVALELMPIVG